MLRRASFFKDSSCFLIMLFNKALSTHYEYKSTVHVHVKVRYCKMCIFVVAKIRDNFSQHIPPPHIRKWLIPNVTGKYAFLLSISNAIF